MRTILQGMILQQAATDNTRDQHAVQLAPMALAGVMDSVYTPNPHRNTLNELRLNEKHFHLKASVM